MYIPSIPKLNELLISHISKDENIQLEKIPNEILEDGILDEIEFLKLCRNILYQLGSENKNFNIKVEKCPDRQTIESIANNKAWIQWSGVFGIYRAQKETIIKDHKRASRVGISFLGLRRKL